MGDGDHGPLVVGEVALQPLDRFGVEMVGRLVEQQQVRLGEQQPAERHPASLAARERPDRRVWRRAAKRVHRVLDHAVEIPGIGRVDLILQARELGRRLLRVVGSQLVEALEQGGELLDPVEHVAAHVL